MRKLLVLLLVVMMLPMAGVAYADEFRVGMECDYAPFNWTQAESSELSVPIASGGYADGYDVQIAKAIAEGLGKELVIVKTEWDGLIPAVQTGAIDAIIAGMSPTAERSMSIDFSDPYYTSDLVIVVKKDGAYGSATQMSDFAGARLTGQLNTVHYSVIPQIEGVLQQTAMETFPAMIVALNSGAVDGYVAERPGAESDVASNPELTYIAFPAGEGFVASPEDVSISVGLQKGSALKAEIDAVLAGIGEDQRTDMMKAAGERRP